MTEKDIIKLIRTDAWMMSVLQAVKELRIPDWWIGAGFVRSKVWDTLHAYEKRTPLPDIDVIYFEEIDLSKNEAQIAATQQEEIYEKKLKEKIPEIKWSVKNQARMHIFHNDQPYKSSEEALAQWVETATCIGARLDSSNNVILTTPRGIDDLVNLVLRPTPGVNKDLSTFNKRVHEKEWLKKWPKLRVILSQP